jgi:hypothetical protein
MPRVALQHAQPPPPLGILNRDQYLQHVCENTRIGGGTPLSIRNDSADDVAHTSKEGYYPLTARLE